MFTNDPFIKIDQQEFAVAKPEQAHVFRVFGMYGVLPFLGQSLLKIKKNVSHPGFRELIEHYIEEHLSHSVPENYESLQEIPIQDFHQNARIAYQKVVAEQEYLHQILHSLDHDWPD